MLVNVYKTHKLLIVEADGLTAELPRESLQARVPGTVSSGTYARPLRSPAGLSGWIGSLFVSRATSILIADGRTDNATHRSPVGRTLWRSNQKYVLFFRAPSAGEPPRFITDKLSLVSIQGIRGEFDYH